MKAKILLNTLLLFLFAATLSAQPTLQFDQITRDMGTLLWHQSRSVTFNVVNKGTNSITIRDVHPDCGCTVAEWTKTPLEPGATGTITVTYDAELLGHFHKQLAVYTNLDDLPTYIGVAGCVSAAITDISADYPAQIGSYYLSSETIEFDDVRRGDSPTSVLTIYNNSKQTYVPQLMHLPSYLSVVADPVSIRPGRVGRLLVTLNSEALPTMGLTQSSVYLSRFPGDRVSAENEIVVSSTLLPELHTSPEQLASAPVLKLSENELNIQLENMKKKTAVITLTNEGRSDLEISALQVYNPGLGVSLSGRIIRPGESRKMRITINPTTHFKGRFRILLITNDPQHPKQTIDINIDSDDGKPAAYRRRYL